MRALLHLALALVPALAAAAQASTRRSAPVQAFASVPDVAAEAQRGGYTADGALDTMRSPTWTQDRLNRGLPAGDCEDTAAWAACSLLKSGLCDEAHLCNAQWQGPRGRTGHTAVLFRVGALWHLLNSGRVHALAHRDDWVRLVTGGQPLRYACTFAVTRMDNDTLRLGWPVLL